MMFSKDKEIIPYIEYHWEALTTTPRRVTSSWHATVHRALLKDIHILFVFEESASDGQMYGLLCSDLTQIRPNYEAMIKGGTLRVTDMGILHGEHIENHGGHARQNKCNVMAFVLKTSLFMLRLKFGRTVVL